MKTEKRIFVFIIYLILGITLMLLGVLEILDSFWSGMGGALIAVGILRVIRILRYCKDESYRENIEIETNDERNQFIRNKAWAWSGYWFVMIAAISCIVLKLLGQDLLSIAAAFAVWVFMVLYWICYLILKKKY